MEDRHREKIELCNFRWMKLRIEIDGESFFTLSILFPPSLLNTWSPYDILTCPTVTKNLQTGYKSQNTLLFIHYTHTDANKDLMHRYSCCLSRIAVKDLKWERKSERERERTTDKPRTLLNTPARKRLITQTPQVIREKQRVPIVLPMRRQA